MKFEISAVFPVSQQAKTVGISNFVDNKALKKERLKI